MTDATSAVLTGSVLDEIVILLAVRGRARDAVALLSVSRLSRRWMCQLTAWRQLLLILWQCDALRSVGDANASYFGEFCARIVSNEPLRCTKLWRSLWKSYARDESPWASNQIFVGIRRPWRLHDPHRLMDSSAHPADDRRDSERLYLCPRQVVRRIVEWCRHEPVPLARSAWLAFAH
jgi:hypothetical protein